MQQATKAVSPKHFVCQKPDRVPKYYKAETHVANTLC